MKNLFWVIPLIAVALLWRIPANQICKNLEPKEEDYLYATVIKESGSIVEKDNLIKISNGNLVSAPPNYIIQVATDDQKNYTLDIKKNVYSSRAPSLELLAASIEIGTRIKLYQPYLKEVLYRHGNIGEYGSDGIQVIQKEK